MQTGRAFDSDWPHGHITRENGFPARIICNDAVGSHPIVALIAFPCGDELVATFRLNGENNLGQTLVNAPPSKKRLQGWANVYSLGGDGTASLFSYPTRESADGNAAAGRFACVYLEIEESEGLL